MTSSLDNYLSLSFPISFSPNKTLEKYIQLFLISKIKCHEEGNTHISFDKINQLLKHKKYLKLILL